MRNLVLALAAAGALSGAAMLSAPALATPIGSLGALNAAAATLSDVEQAAVVCNRWRCWHVYGGPGFYGPRWHEGWHEGWHRRWR
jgi:hypothetical protein